MIDFKEEIAKILIAEDLEKEISEKQAQVRVVTEFQEINETTPLIAEKILSTVLSRFAERPNSDKPIELHIRLNWKKYTDASNRAVFGLYGFNDDICVADFVDFVGKLYSPEMLKTILMEQGIFVQSDLGFKERYEYDAQRDDYTLIVFFSKKMSKQLR